MKTVCTIRLIGCLPFRDFSGPLAFLANIIEGLSEFAPGAAGRIAINANVEELAVFRISVTWVGQTECLVHRGAVECKHV